jgi:hypothetical protein
LDLLIYLMRDGGQRAAQLAGVDHGLVLLRCQSAKLTVGITRDQRFVFPRRGIQKP